MNIKELVSNEFFREESGVWTLSGKQDFEYSDGVVSEKYLEIVLRKSGDLSSRSLELERNIKDWPSEYHLTKKRAQLLDGFDFDPSLKVLEVGCGCGAITRFLGERFRDVVSVEGSIARARLARLRNRDQNHVEILCAPFQEIRFQRKFDIIFCIGVFEYSAWFVNGEDPYNEVLEYFNTLLTSTGTLVVAIENQFGLKYFSSSREDHVGKMYEGLEGYPTCGGKVRTFGRVELEGRLKRYFPRVEFFYPFPDYKVPDCVISESFLKNGLAGEMVAQMKSRDYQGDTGLGFDESLVTLELSKNVALPFFSNSFLAFAEKTESGKSAFKQLAVHYSSNRLPKFRTRTRIIEDSNGEIQAVKELQDGKGGASEGKLAIQETSSKWFASESLQTTVARRCKSEKSSLQEIFEPCKKWVRFLEEAAIEERGERYLSGEFIDATWGNFFWDSGKLAFIDKEWVWKEKIRFPVLVARAIYTFLFRNPGVRGFNKHLKVRNTRTLISSIAKSIGVDLSSRDFEEFIEMESELHSFVGGAGKVRMKFLVLWGMANLDSFFWAMKAQKLIRRLFIKTKVGIKGLLRFAGLSPR